MSNLVAVDDWETTMQIMQIIPDNQIAKKLFTKCYEHLETTKDEYHMKFMVKLPIAEDPLDDEPVESDTEFDSAATVDLAEGLYEGYYDISLAKGLQPNAVEIGWKIGKGSSTTNIVWWTFSLQDQDIYTARRFQDLSVP